MAGTVLEFGETTVNKTDIRDVQQAIGNECLLQKQKPEIRPGR